MKKAIILLVLIPFFIFPQVKMFDKPLSNRIANYTMNVRFDPEGKTVTGELTLNWKNTSNDNITDMQFHLYQNAFRNTNSTLMKKKGGMLKENGYCLIKKVSLSSGSDITERLKYIQPDDGNIHDSTVVSLNLPVPVKPGDFIKLNMEFETKFPPITERSGYEGDFFQVCQWFPKAGVYENGRWVCRQYHYCGEFYADFGVYDVTITVPEKYTVGATGINVSEKNLGYGLKQYRFYCEDVHDFAWTADTDFLEHIDRYKHTKIKLLYQPDHKSMVSRFIKAIKNTLEYYGRWFGEYPYPIVTCIDAQHRGAVMEYPTLFLTGNYSYRGGKYYLPDPVDKKDKYTEMLTIHEFGHNWWMGMVANDETNEAWLDEGINTYSTTKVCETACGDYALEFGNVKRTIREIERSTFIRSPRGIILKPAWEFRDETEWYLMVYKKAEMMLLTFNNYYGEEKWMEVMKTYFQRWKFKHPKTQDFLNVIYEFCGKEWEPFFEQFLYTPHTLDFTVNTVSGNKAVIKNYGQLFFPADIEFSFEDGSKITEKWDGRNSEKTFNFEKNIKRIIIDPENIIDFELDKNNNMWEKSN